MSSNNLSKSQWSAGAKAMIQKYYRWVSPYHWFEEQFLDKHGVHGEVRATVSTLVRMLDADVLEDYFSSEMIEDGYYKTIKQ